MRKSWLLFSQTVTVLLAAYFVVATLKPQWLDRRPTFNAVSILEAPAGGGQRGGGVNSFRDAAKVAAAAVVSINTSRAAAKNPNADDPWFKFFFRRPGPQ